MTIDHVSDETLIKNSQKDPQAFGALYEGNVDAIFAFILHRTGQVSVAEELTAQVFFKAFRKIWQFNWTGIPFSAWLYRIAAHTIHDHMRHRKREMPMEEVSLPMGYQHPDQEAELQRAEAEVARHQAFLQLNTCMMHLKPIDHTIMVLRYFEGKSFKEIAEILGKRRGSVVMRARRALIKLKEQLKQRGLDDERFRETFGTHIQTGPSCP